MFMFIHISCGIALSQNISSNLSMKSLLSYVKKSEKTEWDRVTGVIPKDVKKRLEQRNVNFSRVIREVFVQIDRELCETDNG